MVRNSFKKMVLVGASFAWSFLTVAINFGWIWHYVPVLAAVYLAGVIISAPLMYAFEFAYWQGKYPTLAVKSYQTDMVTSFGMSALSAAIFPVGWLLLWINDQLEYGLRWK